jgi:hypothetical protein
MDVHELPLACGDVALIDAADSAILDDWRWAWRKDSRGYVSSTKATGGGRCKPVRLHRLLLDFPASAIDHANGNKLDNRRCNLRICTNAQNQANRDPLPHSSRFKGVTVRKSTGRFEAQIWNNYKRIWIGTFANEQDAARAYDAAAIEHFGEFARTNFPREQYELAK